MKKPELYQKTVDILVQAYFNDTLEHGNCAACAVGNIIAANNEIDFKRGDSTPCLFWDNKRLPVWGWIFQTDRDKKRQRFSPESYIGEMKAEIDSSGYDLYDLRKIEYAFEMAEKGNSEEDYMFNGLMAVIEVLDTIHKNKDSETTINSKKRFEKITA